MKLPPRATVASLCERYEALLFDAYGVLVDASGALPHARSMLERVLAAGRPFLVVTNDASRLPERNAARLRSLGLPVEASQVLTPGLLVASHLRALRKPDARCVVLGTGDSRAWVEREGYAVCEPDPREPADVVLLCDESGFDFLPTMDRVLSMVLAARERTGRAPLLLLANPDLLYPRAEGLFGFTAGSCALLLEAAWTQRLGPHAPRFLRLGKPHAPLFHLACERLGTKRVVMVGDQLATDVAGAQAAGLDSALVTSGVASLEAELDPEPTWLLDTA